MTDTENVKLQKLLPKNAHFCLEVLHFLEDMHVALHNKKILLAFSGGLDSTALVLLFLLFKEKYNLTLHAVHINHCLREESGDEARHVEQVCKQYNIPLTIITEDVKALSQEWKKGIEESARIVRYNHFSRISCEKNIDYIALGHHLNDLAEDVLMRQIRGAGLEQSSGMQAFDAERRIVRPFLLFEKKMLQELLDDCKIDWVEDASNESNEYLRNRVRNTILPLFLKENPSYLTQVKNNWLQVQNDILYWQKKIAPYFSQNPSFCSREKFSLDRNKFSCEEKALRLRILAEILRNFKALPSSVMLFRLDGLIMKNESNKSVDVNNGLRVTVQREYVEFSRTKD